MSKTIHVECGSETTFDSSPFSTHPGVKCNTCGIHIPCREGFEYGYLKRVD